MQTAPVSRGPGLQGPSDVGPGPELHSLGGASLRDYLGGLIVGCLLLAFLVGQGGVELTK